MNFGRLFNPYGASSIGRSIRSGINWSNILNNTQKTLGIINQAIPVFYQVKPMFNNLKTMFRVANEINKDDTIKTNNDTTNSQAIKNNIRYEKANYISDEGPNFFI